MADAKITYLEHVPPRRFRIQIADGSIIETKLLRRVVPFTEETVRGPQQVLRFMVALPDGHEAAIEADNQHWTLNGKPVTLLDADELLN